MEPIRTILHPTDFSASADHAFRLACSLARDHGARLVVLHVTAPAYPIVPEMVAIPPVAVELPTEEERENLRERLEAIRPAGEDVAIEHRLETGSVVDLITTVAEETGAEWIVMGTHGRTGLNRLLMGSVAEQIVRRAPCPVLTVKLPVARRVAAAPREEERPMMATPY